MYFFDLATEDRKRNFDRAQSSEAVTESGFGYSIMSDVKGTLGGVGSFAFDTSSMLWGATTPAGKGIDYVFGKDTGAQAWIKKQRDGAHKTAESFKADPLTSSLVGQIGHDLTATAIAAAAAFATGGGAPAAAALVGSLQADSTMQEAVHKGADPNTAMGVGAIAGITGAAGVFIPIGLSPRLTVSLAPAMRAPANVGAGIAANVIPGAAQRGSTSALLEERGYPDMARQYQALDANAMIADAVLGGLFGYAGYRHQKALMEPIRRGEFKPEAQDFDTALAMNNQHHLEIDTAPGLIPTPDARNVHIDALVQATKDLLAGDPVNVGAKPSLTDFQPNPQIVALREEIGRAVADHLGLADMERGPLGGERLPLEVPGAVAGNTSSVRVGDQYLPTRWVLIDLAEHKASLQRGENQFRDRTRSASEAQVSAIANAPDFNLLHDAPIMDFGAPTLTRDGKVVGGNGRMEGVSRSYDQGTASGYRDPLLASLWRFGIDPSAAAGMKKPMLARALEADVNTEKAAIASNEGAGMRMSAFEQAKVDSRRLPDLGLLKINDNGDISAFSNQDLIRDWARSMPATEIAAISDKNGHLSVEGFTRLRNAILYRAYGDSPVLARMVESLDPGSKNVITALMRSAAAASEVKSAIEAETMYPVDLVPDIISAVEAFERLRAKGQKVNDYLSQQDIFGDQLTSEAKAILKYIGDNVRSSRNLSEFFNYFWSKVKEAGDPNQGDMFGSKAVNKGELLDLSIKGNDAASKAALDPYSIDALIAEKPHLTILDDEGKPVSARELLARHDEDISIAKEESRAFDVAVACALR